MCRHTGRSGLQGRPRRGQQVQPAGTLCSRLGDPHLRIAAFFSTVATVEHRVSVQMPLWSIEYQYSGHYGTLAVSCRPPTLPVLLGVEACMLQHFAA